MAQQSTYHPLNNLQSHNGESFGHLARDENENDELRGVIDDLTVQNKKLKSLLRLKTRTSPASSGPDRVIEVRMHGVSAEKKRELELLIKSFTNGLAGDSPSQPSSSARIDKSATSAEYGANPGTKPQDLTNTDSGYASISNSGLNATSQSGGLSHRDPFSKSKKEKEIKDYLHDIPDFLFPQRETVSVSDSAKMALVVQRLEQLFTGRRAVPGEHSLPVQQQKISRSAAKADRREDQRLNRTSRTEGSREAHIIPHDSKINIEAMDQERQTYTDAGGQRRENPPASDISLAENPVQTSDRSGSPEQRPTRPLDLDIHRAQVAADNIEYIRHLGFSSPQFDEDADREIQPWMYLNLLVSMAQLHTLNVTPAFVRKAVKQLSTKFELSKDGHKIRWKGGSSPIPYLPTQASPMSATQRVVEDPSDEAGRQSGRSVTSTLNDHGSTSISDDKATRGVASGTSKLVNSTTNSSNYAIDQPSARSKSTSAFDYKPIVYQGKKTFLKAKTSYLDSSSSHDDFSPDSSGLARGLSRSSLHPREDAREGFMTFFSNTHYFTDLSGDRSSTSVQGAGQRGARDAVGVKRKYPFEEEDNRDPDACYFNSVTADASSDSASECPDINMTSTPITSAGEYETVPMELPASGIGGVRPEDNFALDVKVERSKTDQVGTKVRSAKGPARYSYKTTECKRLALQPSRLPPPSYVFFTASSSSDAEKGNFYDDDSNESSDAEESPAPAGFLWQWSSSSNERQVAEDELSEASSSLGVLEAARARISHVGNLPEGGRTMSGSLAATVGASWSAASVAEPEPEAESAAGDDESSSEMSMIPEC